MTNYEKTREELLKDPEVMAAYEELRPEFEIVSQLIAARATLNLTQKQLADRIGIKQSHISRLESGRYNPSLHFLKKVAGGLGKQLCVEFK
jgi:DNA-binding XRE family transcriptional regulator